MLYGVLHSPSQNARSELIITMVTGGPQTRFGGHRLYVQLARFLCAKGISVFRFDYEGMGDSEGDLVRFEGAGPSIGAAIDFLTNRFSIETKVIIWSLCDGCPPSITFSAENHSQIAGLIMCNPFILDGESIAAHAHLKFYYARRFLSKAFWIKLFSFKVSIINELKNISLKIKLAYFAPKNLPNGFRLTDKSSLKYSVLDNIELISIPICFIFGAEDIVAMSFYDFFKKASKIDNKNFKNVISQHILKGADHTFTEPQMKNDLFRATLNSFHKIEHLATIK